MNKKTILILSLIVSAVLLISLSITIVQSQRRPRRLKIPTEWYQTPTSLIMTEIWSWDWTTYGTDVPWPVAYMLYQRVGDAVFFALHPLYPVLVAYRAGQTLTWGWRGGETVMGGPMMAHLMMFNGTISITFTNEDIPLTDDDNDYKGLRILVEMTLDLYGLASIGDGNYLWGGLAHTHIVFWAPKGS